MKSKYNYVGLLDVCSVTTGSSNVVDAVDDGTYAFFDRSQNVKRSNKFLFDTEATIVPGEGQDFIPRYYCGKFDLHQRSYAIIPGNKIDGIYLYYAVLCLKDHFKQIAVGSTVKSLRLDSFATMKIPLPDMKIQKTIGSMLHSLDLLILKNRITNDYLVEIAQELFTEQFGAMLLDDEPPAGWKKGRYDDIITIHDSKRIPLSGNERENMDQIYPYYGAASVAGYVDDYIFDGVYLLFGEDGTVIDEKGNPSLQYVWGKFWVNNHAHILTGRNGFSVESLFLLSKQLKVESIITGAVQPKISQNSMKNIALNIPSEEKILSFNKKIVPIFNKYRNNYDENRRLSILRDALLPKLMSGEIDVSNFDSGS